VLQSQRYRLSLQSNALYRYVKGCFRFSSSITFDGNLYHEGTRKNPDDTWCAGYTQIEDLYVLAVLDLATGQILGHLLSFKPSAASKKDASMLFPNLIDFFDSVTKKRFARPDVFHSADKKCFTSVAFQEHLSNLGVKQTVCKDAQLGNKIIARWNNCFRDDLRIQIEKLSSSDKHPASGQQNALKDLNLFKREQIKKLVSHAIEYHNTSDNSPFKGVSPQLLDNFLMLYSSLKTRFLLGDKTFNAEYNETMDLINSGYTPLFFMYSGYAPLSLRDREGGLCKFAYYRLRKLALFFDTLPTTKESPNTYNSASQNILDQLTTECSSNGIDTTLTPFAYQELNVVYRKERERYRKLKKHPDFVYIVRTLFHLLIDDEPYTLLLGLSRIRSAKYETEFARDRDLVALILLFCTRLDIESLLHLSPSTLRELLDCTVHTQMCAVNVILKENGKQTVSLSTPIANRYYPILNTYHDTLTRFLDAKSGQEYLFTVEGSTTCSITLSDFTHEITYLVDETYLEKEQIDRIRLLRSFRGESLKIGYLSFLVGEFGIACAQQAIEQLKELHYIGPNREDPK
jgi:hypothetical protein